VPTTLAVAGLRVFLLVNYCNLICYTLNVIRNILRFNFELELALELNPVYDIQKIAEILSATFLNEAAHPANITQLRMVRCFLPSKERGTMDMIILKMLTRKVLGILL